MKKELEQLVISTFHESKDSLIMFGKFVAILGYGAAVCFIVETINDLRLRRKRIKEERRFRIIQKFNSCLKTYGLLSVESANFYIRESKCDSKLINRLNQVILNTIDDRIVEWSDTKDPKMPVFEFIGLSWNQYTKFVMQPNKFCESLYE